MEEIRTRDGDLVLKDYDGHDLDATTNDRLYCIAYVDAEGEHDLMLFWRRGDTIRSRSITGDKGGYGRSMADIASFARLAMEAQRLLGDDS